MGARLRVICVMLRSLVGVIAIFEAGLLIGFAIRALDFAHDWLTALLYGLAAVGCLLLSFVMLVLRGGE